VALLSIYVMTINDSPLSECKSNGTCIPEGTKWEENCFTYTCKKESDNKYTTDVIQVSK
jgi:hypothetical protein